ncbi:MAG: autotransporter-associated beta strand repeat-containing protein [Thermoguttaceae bacterium]|nr:autotransporter-associated beta strand repeat-containing protein [Thermoguttaceae bacterium]
MRYTSFCLFLSSLVLLASAASAAVIVDGVDTGQDSYTVSDANKASVFTGTGTLIQTGQGGSPQVFNGSLTGFSGILKITGTTGQYWMFGGPNMVKGAGNDLEMTIAQNTVLVLTDPDASAPIEYHFSVLNGGGSIRTSNATQVRTCTLVVGTDTAGYDGASGHNFTGNIATWNINLGGQSNFNLKKVGTNTQTLSGNNFGFTASNRIDIEGGMLVSNKSTALGAAHVYVNPGASLYFNETQTVANTIEFAGTGVGNNTAALRIYGNITFTGNLTLNADSTIYVQPNYTSKITNQLWGKSQANTLTKTGGGILSIATQPDVNTIKGVVIQGGVLEAASANALGGNNVKLAGGRLRLKTDVGRITFAAAGDGFTPSGAIEVNAAEGESWDLTNYQTGANIKFEKTGAGTVRMTGNYSGGTLQSIEIKAGKIQIYGDTAESARVFPANVNAVISQGAQVEYLKNSQDFNNICPYSIYGGELISNIEGTHLTVGHVGLYGGTLTGVGDGSNYGNFLFDGNFTAYQTDINGGVSNVNAAKVDFGFRNGNATKAIQVKAGAQLNMNAVITSAFTSGVGNITKIGDGLLVFTKENVYNLPTNVNEGTLKLAEDGTLGNASKTTTVSDGATLEIANEKTHSNAITLNGAGVATTVEDVTTYAGALNFTADATLDGIITLNTDSTINVAEDKTAQITNELWGKTNANTLTKIGAGTLKIASADEKNSLKGVVIQEGVLEAASANALGGASGNNVTLDGGTLRLSTDVGTMKFAAAEEEVFTPSGTIELNAAAGESWDLANYQTGENISLVKTGAGTVRMSGNYNGKTLESVKIQEGKIQIYVKDPSAANPEWQALVFPTTSDVEVYQGAAVEYLYNPKQAQYINTYTLYGGELISNIPDNHLTTGPVNFYGGTLTGVGNGSTGYGSFLFDGDLTVYPSDEYGNVSEINANFVDFEFRRDGAARAIDVKEGAQLDVNANIKSAGKPITKTGDGVLNLTKANTYNQPTNVNGGTLLLSEDGTLGNASKAVTVKDGATLEIANGATVANALTVSGTGYDDAGAVNFTSDGTLGGAVTLGADTTINVADGKNATLAGSVAASNFSLTKTGPGTLTVGDACVVSSNLIVSEGALNLSGTVNGLEVQDGATAIMNGTADGDITLSGTWLNQIDQTGLRLLGDFTIDGEIYIPTENVPEDTIVTLMRLEDGALVNGQTALEDIAEELANYLTEESGRVWSLTSQNGSIVAMMGSVPPGPGPGPGGDVPEPATWLLLLLGFGGLMVWKKK